MKRGEKATEDDLAVTLNGERGDTVVGIRIEFGIDGAVRVQTRNPVPGARRRIAGRIQGCKATTNDQLTLHVRRKREHDAVGIRIVAGIQRTVSIETGEVIASRGLRGAVSLYAGE